MASKKKFPPGPDLLTLASNQTRNACINLQYLVSRYGNICRTPGPFGYYLISEPDYIEYILKVNHLNYRKTDLAYQGITKILGHNLLTNPDYDSWLQERKLLQPLFHHHHLTHYADTISKATLQLCQRWHKLTKQQQPINLLPEMFDLLFEIICKTIFGGDFTEHAIDFLHYNDIGNAYVGKALFLCSWVPSLPALRFKKAKQQIDQLILAVINKRRNASIPPTSTDLIAILLGAQSANAYLTDQYLIDEIKTFLITGSETTSTALTWFWYCLATNPIANDCLQQEISTQLNGNLPNTTTIENLSYTRMAFEETLRLYPPLWMVSRRAIADDYLGEYFVPAGKIIAISPYVIQRHPDYWSQPNHFNPLNFSEDNKRKRVKYTYIPFGLGPRACIGSVFSTFEAQLIIPIIAQQFDFELLATEPIGLASYITLRPEGGVWVKLKPKKS